MNAVTDTLMDMSKLYCPHGCNAYLSVLADTAVAICTTTGCTGYWSKEYSSADEVLNWASQLRHTASLSLDQAYEAQRTAREQRIVAERRAVRARLVNERIGEQFNQLNS